MLLLHRTEISLSTKTYKKITKTKMEIKIN